MRPAVFSLWPLRLTLAAVFVQHGWTMLTDVASYGRMFEGLGIPAAGVVAILVAVAEFFGGLGLLLGILTRFTGAVLSVVMGTAILVAWLPEGPFFGGWAFDLALLGGLLAVTLNGPGRPTLASMLEQSWLDPEELLWARLRR